MASKRPGPAFRKFSPHPDTNDYSTLLARRFENWPPPHDFADLMIDLVATPFVFTLLAACSYHREVRYVSQTVYEGIGPGYPDDLTRVARDNAALLRKT